MNGDFLEERSKEFQVELLRAKSDGSKIVRWYPYGTLANFTHLRGIFNKFPLDGLLPGNKKTLDIGAADGDLAFFLESLGYAVDIIDKAPTRLACARFLKEKLQSSVNIHEIDLDAQFTLPSTQYGLVFFLGILYHLRNPFYVLEALSRAASHLVLSTRIARFTPDGTLIANSPLAYLVGPTEANNDASNFWVFSDAGLRRIFDRTGWDILEMITLGDTEKSNPRDLEHDERAFALLRSRHANRQEMTVEGAKSSALSVLP